MIHQFACSEPWTHMQVTPHADAICNDGEQQSRGHAASALLDLLASAGYAFKLSKFPIDENKQAAFQNRSCRSLWQRNTNHTKHEPSVEDTRSPGHAVAWSPQPDGGLTSSTTSVYCATSLRMRRACGLAQETWQG